MAPATAHRRHTQEHTMTRSIRKMFALTVLATTLLSSMALVFPEADAHERRITHGKDSAWITADHRSGVVCDNERDGHYVYGEYETIYGTVTVDDGGDYGCDYVPHQGVNISAFRLCEEGQGCTDWYRA
jgi:hypothetical protein